MDRVEVLDPTGSEFTASFEALNDLLGDAAAIRAEAERHGYLFFRRLLDPVLPLALRRRVLEKCREFGWLAEGTDDSEGIARSGARIGSYDDPAWIELQCHVHPSPEFAALRDNPAILAVLESIFDAPARVGRGDTCRVFSPRCAELTTPPHQDQFYVRGSTRTWTAWIPLGDCPRELGGLALLPGSHRRGLEPHAGEGSGRAGVDVRPDALWWSIAYECGDVLLFNCLTIHKALENRTEHSLRCSADFRYEPRGA